MNKTRGLLFTASIVLATTFTLSLMSCASTAKATDMTYSETVNVPGVSAEDLYAKANLWFSDAFKGPDATQISQNVPGFRIPETSRITSTDKNNGVIQGNYTFLTDMSDNPFVFQVFLTYSTVRLQVSDGQYRLVFSNPINGAATYNRRDEKWIYSSTAPLLSKYVEATHNVWHELAESLRNTVGGTLAGK
jgi:hypothetical protein